MASDQTPSLDLEEVKQLVRLQRYTVDWQVDIDCQRLEFDRADLEDCILGLGPGDFYKTMPGTSIGGVMMDVYLPVYCGKSLYVKFFMDEDCLRITSFKESDSK